MKAKRKRQYDVRDREALEGMLHSHAWALFAARVEKAVDAKRRDLERDLSEKETATVRGFLEGVRSVMDIPKILIREAAAAPVVDPGEKNLREA